MTYSNGVDKGLGSVFDFLHFSFHFLSGTVLDSHLGENLRKEERKKKKKKRTVCEGTHATQEEKRLTTTTRSARMFDRDPHT